MAMLNSVNEVNLYAHNLKNKVILIFIW